MRKFVRKHRRTADYIRTHTHTQSKGKGERDWHTYALWQRWDCSLSCSLPRCGNYFFLCENKWNLHDTWVILHVNCFFWQTTQANTKDQPRGREGGKQTEMVAIVVFSVFTSVQQCQGESLVRVEQLLLATASSSSSSSSCCCRFIYHSDCCWLYASWNEFYIFGLCLAIAPLYALLTQLS